MKVLYLDCFSGISGDMTVGALRDLGVDEKVFLSAISALGLGGEIHTHFSRESRCGITGTKFDVHSHAHEHPHSGHHGHAHEHGHSHAHGRTHAEIRALLQSSRLGAGVRERALAVFARIAEAEGKIHGVPPAEVGFHEVGAVDSIADIVAACAGFAALGDVRIEASVPVEGAGWIECAHGKFPIPAPATLEILAGIPVRQVDEPVEFITPTGAALLAEFATRFGPLPEMRPEKTGYGVGSRDTSPRPNVLRAVLGDDGRSDESDTDEVVELRTNLDDMTPEHLGAAMNRIFRAGALDVFFTPVQMKKNRPGVLLTAVCRPADAPVIAKVILTETSAFGVRCHPCRRFKLRREFRDVETPYGSVRLKLGFLGDDLVQAAPEFESCRAAAEASGVSVRDVHLAACIGPPPPPEGSCPALPPPDNARD